MFLCPVLLIAAVFRSFPPPVFAGTARCLSGGICRAPARFSLISYCTILFHTAMVQGGGPYICCLARQSALKLSQPRCSNFRMAFPGPCPLFSALPRIHCAFSFFQSTSQNQSWRGLCCLDRCWHPRYIHYFRYCVPAGRQPARRCWHCFDYCRIFAA